MHEHRIEQRGNMETVPAAAVYLTTRDESVFDEQTGELVGEVTVHYFRVPVEQQPRNAGFLGGDA